MVHKNTISRSSTPVQKSTQSHPTEVDEQDRALFRALDLDGDGKITREDFVKALGRTGLRLTDRRLQESVAHLNRLAPGNSKTLDLMTFQEVIKPNIHLIRRALRSLLIIPDFKDFCTDLDEIYNEVSKIQEGDVASYIPQLARVPPEHFGVAVCTIDGQRYSRGDTSLDFSIQSTNKPINYCLALEEHGPEVVHQHVGREPSGRGFNELALNHRDRPHNPLINAGAIMCCSLLQPHKIHADRFDYVLEKWGALTGRDKVGFNNAVFLSERGTAHRNQALGHYMMEKGAFPQGTDLQQTLEFYFQCCSIELNAEKMSVVAATLANGGSCPVTGDKIFKTTTVQNCLSLMYSCGMYDYSGEWAFTIGLPAKSGVSGALVVVVPNVLGLCIWSPPLDSSGNSVRGIELCKRLVSRFNFHNYDSLTAQSEKRNPRLSRIQKESEEVTGMIEVASKGDLTAVEQYHLLGVNLNAGDYDTRTPLHLAAAEGHENVVRYLLSNGANPNVTDRWGGTPLDDAERHSRSTVARLLQEHGGGRGVNQGSFHPTQVEGSGAAEVTALIWAASTGSVEAIQPYVARGIALDSADYDGRTPLHLAASNGHETMVIYLLGAGCRLNPLDRWGCTPLDDAARHQHLAVADLLRRAGGRTGDDLRQPAETPRAG